ncbi:hypothetical protein TanjilG_00599 [Lupinus angustifolius]|uniref:Uncharacterized protein n=1 Tax=Lupinus angustifolius TaxID=3871 RepID=A0A1J7FV34_LUPAN|nr:PREDICTED: uncharacterized protein LOC109333699 [Lupinus angustifolius]OIV91931.1 hypothetical protein TanjilG_00599 [Lupinus angustifolius]
MSRIYKKHYDYSGNGSVMMNLSEGVTQSDDVSARKLAARLWQLRFMEELAEAGSHCELDNGDIKIKFPHFHNSGEIVKKTKCLWRPINILRSRNGLQCKLKSSLPCLKCSKEESKWDPALAQASNEFTKNHSRNLLEAKKLLAYHDSVVTALLKELLLAQKSINKLKSAQNSSKKKVQQFLQNLEDEKTLWKHREYKKIQANLCNLKDKLSREKRSRERMELLNTKLVHELAEANFYAKKFMTNYVKEKKERELYEKVCNQLAMQIEEDKAKIEELLSMSMKLCEEVKEERKMMQMVDLWREERTQMRLVDAKLVLQDKHNQMVQLIGYLKMFLRSRGAELGTIFESVNIQQIVEPSHYFAKFEEIFQIYEELRKDNANPLSTIHIVSLNEEELNKKTILHEPSPSGDYNTITEPTSSSECSVKSGLKSLKTQSKWRASPGSKLLRSCPNVGATSSSAKANQHRRQGKGSVEGSFRHKELLGQGSSRDTMNPHITRGIKGCIEWPRGIPKAN